MGREWGSVSQKAFEGFYMKGKGELEEPLKRPATNSALIQGRSLVAAWSISEREKCHIS